jgi:hypothetical protein
MEKVVFKYDMSLYYQSAIIYTVAMIGYILLRAQFVGLNFESYIHDPISYLFLLVIGYTLLGTAFNLIRKKRIEFYEDGFIIDTRFDRKEFKLSDIKSLIIRRENKFHFQGIFRTVKIRMQQRVYPFYIRPFDYDEENLLLEEFRRLREKIQSIKNGEDELDV